jgi:alpha-tubulin suppressor-like RCC1 family protein
MKNLITMLLSVVLLAACTSTSASHSASLSDPDVASQKSSKSPRFTDAESASKSTTDSNAVDDTQSKIVSATDDVTILPKEQLPVSSGGFNYFVIKSDGTLISWGENMAGVTNVQNKEYLIENYSQVMKDVSFATAGQWVSYIIDYSGDLYGLGTNVCRLYSVVTTDNKKGIVKIMSDVEMISYSVSQSLAIKTDNTLWALGSLFSKSYLEYEPVDGIIHSTLSPVKIMDDVRYVTQSMDISYAIKMDETLWRLDKRSRNKIVKLKDNIKSFSPFSNVCYAITNDNVLWRIGLSTDIKIAENIKSVYAGNENEVLVAKLDGSVLKIEYDDENDLFNCNYLTQIKNASFVTGYGGSYQVVEKDGSLWMWGNNSFGRLGDGTDKDIPEPKKIMDNVAYVTNSLNCSLIVDQSGCLWSAGYDVFMYGETNNKIEFYAPRVLMCNVRHE